MGNLGSSHFNFWFYFRIEYKAKSVHCAKDLGFHTSPLPKQKDMAPHAFLWWSPRPGQPLDKEHRVPPCTCDLSEPL